MQGLYHPYVKPEDSLDFFYLFNKNPGREIIVSQRHLPPEESRRDL